MLTDAAWLLAAGALGGLVLVGLYQLPSARRLAWPGMIHGLAGLAGFVLLVLGLRGPARGVQQGVGSFGIVAAVLVGLALLVGATVAWSRWRRTAPSLLGIGVHATLGVAGLVMLAAYLSA